MKKNDWVIIKPQYVLDKDKDEDKIYLVTNIFQEEKAMYMAEYLSNEVFKIYIDMVEVVSNSEIKYRKFKKECELKEEQSFLDTVEKVEKEIGKSFKSLEEKKEDLVMEALRQLWREGIENFCTSINE